MLVTVPEGIKRDVVAAIRLARCHDCLSASVFAASDLDLLANIEVSLATAAAAAAAAAAGVRLLLVGCCSSKRRGRGGRRRFVDRFRFLVRFGRREASSSRSSRPSTGR